MNRTMDQIPEELRTMNSQDEDGNTLLHLTVMNRRRPSAMKTVRLLLDRGVNVNLQNKKGWSPLHCVVGDGDNFSSKLEVIKWLVDAGTDVNMQDNDGNTPLHLTFKSRRFILHLRQPSHLLFRRTYNRYRPSCSRVNNVATEDEANDIVRLLLDTGANVNIQNRDGMSPLHCMTALDEGYLQCPDDIIKSIISRTINVNVKDNKGQTPVHLCVNNFNLDPEYFSTLLDWGGSVLLENNDGKTPAQYLSGSRDPLLNNCLTRYTQRVKCANLVNDVEFPIDHVDDDVFSMLNELAYTRLLLHRLPKDHLDYDDYKSELLNELELMKQEKVGWSTVHDVFAKYQDPLFVNNVQLNAVIESPQFEKKYSRYGQLLKSTFVKAKKRKTVLDKAVDCFKIPIPIEARRMILSNLDCSDILSLITSYERAQD